MLINGGLARLPVLTAGSRRRTAGMREQVFNGMQWVACIACVSEVSP
jgi:hypothetical protein